MIVIINYDISNTLFIKNAVAKLDYKCRITNNKTINNKSNHII